MLPLRWLFNAGLWCLQQSVTVASGSSTKPPDLRLQTRQLAGSNQRPSSPSASSGLQLGTAGRPSAASRPGNCPPPPHTHPAGGPGRREASRDVTQTGWAFTHRPGSTNEQASLGYIYSLHSRRPYCLAREEGEQRPPDNGGARRVASFAPAFGLLQPLLPRPVRRQRLPVAPREGGGWDLEKGRRCCCSSQW